FLSKQVGLMQKQLEATDRPWIKIADISLSSPLVLHGDVGPNVGIKFVIRNVGHSVARDVQIHALVILHKFSDNSQAVLDRQKDHCETAVAASDQIEAMGSFNAWAIFPDDTIERKDLMFGFVHRAIESTARSFP